MVIWNRREFLVTAAALASRVLVGSAPGFGEPARVEGPAGGRVLVGSDTDEGILSFGWDAATGTLMPEGIAAKVPQSTWIALSADRQFLYVACELNEFEGKATGAVGSFRVAQGADGGLAGLLTPVSLVGAHGQGTCHLGIDKTGQTVVAANYTGGSATSFLSTKGQIAEVWTEAYRGQGPVTDRQEKAHAHFAAFSPDNRFVYVNDLGSDRIHIYALDAATARLTPAGAYRAQIGEGPRTLRFHPNGRFAYCVNELTSSITVLRWNSPNGTLTPVQHVSLDPDPAKAPNTACDTVITRDGRFAYFSNRGEDFLKSFHVEPATGRLMPFEAGFKTPCLGKTPRNHTLDPTERWMLVANQGSGTITVFARDVKTGVISPEGKNTVAATPMCLVFL